MNEPLLDVIGFVGGLVAVLVDRRRAVPIASAAVAICLTPSSVAFGGDRAGLVLIGAALAAAIGAGLARTAAAKLPRGPGLDPMIPVFAPRRELFGPRSLRMVAAALMALAASWVSYNIPIGSVAVVRGLFFPTAFSFGCGAIRLLLARTIEDLAVGVAVIGLATSSAWFLRGGDDPTAGAIAAAALAPLAAIVADWLGGRHSGLNAALARGRTAPGPEDSEAASAAAP